MIEFLKSFNWYVIGYLIACIVMYYGLLKWIGATYGS